MERVVNFFCRPESDTQPAEALHATAMQDCPRHRVVKRDSSKSSSLTNLREVSSESSPTRAIR